MHTNPRHLWILRVALLALIGLGITALLPSDFKAAASSMGASASASTVQPAATKLSMPAPKLLVSIAQPPSPIAAPNATASQTSPSSSASEVPTKAPAASQAGDAGLAAQVGSSGVNVRAGAASTFPVLFTLAPGANIQTRERVGGWVHISADSGDGWIYASYLAGDPANPAPNAAPQPAAGSALVGRRVHVSSPSPVYDSEGGARIFTLGANERVRVVEADNNWIRIMTDTGESGWLKLR